MGHLVYSVRYSVAPINSSLLTITLHCSVITTPFYDDTKYSVPFMTLQYKGVRLYFCTEYKWDIRSSRMLRNVYG
jgi:hypothetical protein